MTTGVLQLAGCQVKGSSNIKKKFIFPFFNDRIIISLVCSPVTDPGWEAPRGAGPGPHLPAPTLWAMLRVVDRHSHTDPKGFTFPCILGHAWEPPVLCTLLPDPLAAATAAAATGP